MDENRACSMILHVSEGVGGCDAKGKTILYLHILPRMRR